MAVTVSEASAVFDLLHWLGVHPLGEQLVDDDRAARALELLANHAGKTLGIGVQPGEARQAIDKLAGRLAAADSDGAAQAVCRGLATHIQHGGSIPWPTIRRPLEDWETRRFVLEARARAELDGQTCIEDHL